MDQIFNESTRQQMKLEALVSINDMMMDRLERDVEEFQISFARGADWEVKRLQLVNRLDAYSRLVRGFQG